MPAIAVALIFRWSHFPVPLKRLSVRDLKTLAKFPALWKTRNNMEKRLSCKRFSVGIQFDRMPELETSFTQLTSTPNLKYYGKR